MGRESKEARVERVHKSLLALISAVPWGVGSVPLWWIIILLSAALLSWVDRHFSNPDGMSYLDIAAAVANNRLIELVNGLWSPGYPALVSIILRLLRPLPEEEFGAAHFVNFFAVAFALGAFAYFLRNWRSTLSRDVSFSGAEEEPYFTALAYSVFMCLLFLMVPVELICPDLWVIGFVFLAAGLGCRIGLSGTRWSHFAALGLVLGLSYYFKEAMFPLGLTLWAMLFLSPPKSVSSARLWLLLTLAVFAATAAPLVVAVSMKLNRVAIGNAGRINYGWWVNGLPSTPPDERPRTERTFEHPAPKLANQPLILDFRFGTGGTYPLWYDPSFWFRDQKIYFDLRKQVGALWRGIKSQLFFIGWTPWLPIGVLLLALWNRRQTEACQRIGRHWWLLAWPASACAMYALVWVERRYVGGFMILWWVVLFTALTRQGGNGTKSVAVRLLLSCVIALCFTAGTARVVYGVVRALNRPRPPEYRVAAMALRQAGLAQGDRVALVGSASDFYGPRCVRIEIAAQIPFAQEFWNLNEKELRRVSECLTSVGIKAIVGRNRPAETAPAEWMDVRLSQTQSMSILLLPSRASSE